MSQPQEAVTQDPIQFAKIPATCKICSEPCTNGYVIRDGVLRCFACEALEEVPHVGTFD